MKHELGLVVISLIASLGCSEKSGLKNGPSTGGNADASAGGAGGGGTSGSGTGGRTGGTVATGGSTATGGTGALGGSFGTGGTMSSGTGVAATGGASTGGTVATVGRTSAGGTTGATGLGGTTSGTGGRATGGTSSVGTGGSSMGGQTGTTSPANDTPGQDPFVRPASSGILITSSDGLNGIDLILAADTKGGMFLAGATRNPKAMGLAAFDSGVESEAFAARMDAQGKLVWSVPLKICGVPADVAAGPDDSVYVLCPYEPDATSLMPFTCDAAASVEKLAGSDGKVIFEARVNVPAAPADGYMCPYGLGVDAQGRSYVGGAYSPTSPSERIIVSAVTAAGQQDWTLISDGPATDAAANSAVAYANDVDVDASGNVLFVGGFNTWMKIGTTQLTSQATKGSSSMYNGFVGQVAANGSGPTAWRFGGTVFDMATAIAPTADGGFVLGGWVSASSSIGGKTVSAGQDGSALVARLTSQGQATWAKVIPGTSIADAVAVGSDGKAYVVGQFANDEILYTYDPAADSLTARKTVAGNATDNALRTRSVAVSSLGTVWLSGTFQGTINLGTGALTTTTASSFLLKVN